MTRTVTDLATAVLRRLRVIGSSDTPGPARAAMVTTFYADHFQELEDDEIAFWDEASIPERAFTALVDLVAGRLAPSFGLSRADLEESGERRLRRLAAESSDGAPIAGEFY